MLKCLLRVCFLPEMTSAAPQGYPRVIMWIRRYQPQRWGLGAGGTVRNTPTVQMPQALFLACCRQGWEQSPKRWYSATWFSNFETSPLRIMMDSKTERRVRDPPLPVLPLTTFSSLFHLSHTWHQETLPKNGFSWNNIPMKMVFFSLSWHNGSLNHSKHQPTASAYICSPKENEWCSKTSQTIMHKDFTIGSLLENKQAQW